MTAGPLVAPRGRHVAVGGPQGVGKSTAVRLLAGRCPTLDVLSIGEEFPDDFASLPPAGRRRVRADISERVAARLAAADGVVVADLHYLDHREPEPRLQPPELLAHFGLRIVLSAPPEVLLARRASDPTRADRSLALVDVRRDLLAHLRYAEHELGQDGRALVLDCGDDPDAVAKRLKDTIERWVATSG